MTVFDEVDAKVGLLRTRGSFWLRSGKDDDKKDDGEGIVGECIPHRSGTAECYELADC